MSDRKPLYLGPRLKRLRRELGLTQQAVADDLGISPSYIALLERNQRPVTAELLLRLARTYRLEIDDLAPEEGEDHARRISEVLRDPIFAEIDLPALEIADLAGSFPGVTEAFLRLYGAYSREHAALADRSGDSADGQDPVAEARRFVAARRNHFPMLETAAESLTAAIADAGGAERYLGKAHGIRVRYLPGTVLMDAVRRFDRHNQQLLLDEALPASSRAWQLAMQVVYIECRPQFSALLREAALSTPTAEALVRRALAAYAAAAILMPYERFGRAVEERQYDIEALAGLFGTSFEQVAHRLTTLSRPEQERVPFFFIRVDPAGNVSKRLDGAGFPFASHGGGCPLWNVHLAFRSPHEVLTQWLELPDGQRYFSIARMVVTGGGAFGRQRVEHAIALACAAEHAPKLVYAQGVDPRRVAATPIGPSCRLCYRPTCAARAAPPIGREITLEDYRRGREPFGFAEG